MISPKYFDTFFYGLPTQLEELSLDGAVEYVRNHIHSFILDESIGTCFVERLANDPDIGKHSEGSRALVYLMNKVLQLRPFRISLLSLYNTIIPNQSIAERLEILRKLHTEQALYESAADLNFNYDADTAQQHLLQLLEKTPMDAASAQLALHVDRHVGQKPGPWSQVFKCPAFLKKEWDIALFNHYASLPLYDEARALWDTLDQSLVRETTLNLAAEMFVAEGNIPKGILMYAKSLMLDPLQTPIKLRMRELENPFQASTSLLETKSVNICLYSWNKADILDETLQSLSESEIGNARIDVLLNGCTDHSLEVVEKARELFPDNEFVLHNLHVNIGAPAARNWLMFHPDVQKSEYIAFLDDDVTVQQDWLSHFLTIAEQDPKIGVVGCKTVHPGTPTEFQYLYRYIAIAESGLLKMSISAPSRQFDNHAYDFVRECRNVMGCQHLLRTKALNAIPAGFDIRFSPSQVDDIDHDICVCLEGYKVMYTGLVTCVHHQSSGVSIKNETMSFSQAGSVLGNDIKLFAKHSGRLEQLKGLDILSLDVEENLPQF